MTYRVDRSEDCLTVCADAPLVSLRYWRNPFHYHKDVYRLEFELLKPLERSELLAVVHLLLNDLKKTLPKGAAICRTTVVNPSGLLSVLRGVGFLETRYVYEPVLDPASVHVTNRHYLGLGGHSFDLSPLTDLPKGAQHYLLDTFVDVYAQVPRLDPVTPKRVLRRDWRALLFEDLVPEVSAVLLERGLPVGLAAVYKDGASGSYQLGVTGVRTAFAARREQLVGTLLDKVVSLLQDADARQLRAEVDSDDPALCYACARLPFMPDRVSTSLMWVPRWSQTGGLD